MNGFTGLIQEPAEALEAMHADSFSLEGVRCSAETETRWEKVPDWMLRDDQGRMNSCVAHGCTAALEKLEHIKTGQAVQLSRLFVYKVAQKESGIRGDSGAMLSGASRAMKKYGAPREEVFPYAAYDTPLTDAAFEDAKARIVTHTIRLPDYQTWRTALGGNICGILTASKWGIELDANGYARRYRPIGNGGHAYSAFGLATTSDAQGRPDVLMFNSHRNRFVFKVSATWVDQVTGASPNESVGFTDMTVPTPRPIDWLAASPEYL